jgi:hypothetical protein
MAAAGEPFMAHFGAALLAGWWFATDQCSAGLETAIARTADQVVSKHRWLFDEIPSSDPGAGLEPELVEHIGGEHLDGVWAIGHDVILTALAVRTFQARPELCTAQVVDGIHRVIDACHQQPFVQIAGRFDVEARRDDLEGLSLDAPGEVARLALETMVGVVHVYAGLHQGEIGHVVDHAHALITFDRLGYQAEFQRGRLGFLTHVAGLRQIAQEETDLAEVTAGVEDDARHPAYWEHDFTTNDWAVGHVFKYPYALYELLALVDDPPLARRSMRRMGELIVDQR